MKCHKDKSRTCGNGMRNSVFVLPVPEEKFEGCYKDAGDRDLPTRLDNKGDPKRCLDMAKE
jgi:hypothetical protein